MALILWNTDDSFENLNAIWSGGQTTSGVRLFSEPFYTYIGGNHTVSGGAIQYITRILTSGVIPSGDLATSVDISPDDTTANRIEISTFYSEFGISMSVVGIESKTPDGKVFFSNYATSGGGGWTQANVVSGFVQDVVFPEYITLPRFLVGISGVATDHVLVVTASGNLETRYPSNWSAMTSGSSVTDLEILRLV